MTITQTYVQPLADVGDMKAAYTYRVVGTVHIDGVKWYHVVLAGAANESPTWAVPASDVRVTREEVIRDDPY